MEKSLRRGFAALALPATDAQIQQLLRYAALLLAQNAHMNLTAITEPEAVAELHFLDSAALLPLGGAASRADWDGLHLIDVGTGAGFPGLVLKILCPEMHVTLLDSQEKRILWLRAVCAELGLTGVTCVHGRGELLGHDPAYRAQFDLATARAVAPLPLLCELCLPFLRTGGQLLAMKGPHGAEELAAAKGAISALGGDEGALRAYRLPLTGAARTVISVRKRSPTEAQFPRKWTKMKKGVL